jgi:hypothetical protein
MALIAANATRLGCLNRTFSGVASVAGGHRRESIGLLNGPRRNWYVGWHAVTGVTDRSSVPEGNRHPVAWLMAPKAGGMASRNESDFALAPGPLLLAAGRNVEGASTIELTVAPAALQLIVNAAGSATITFSVGNAALAGALFGVGTSSVTFTVNTPTLGAVVDAIGTAGINFAASATIRAIGHMEGDISPFSELSPESLAAAVWSAIDTANNLPGTMGAKVNAAGGAADPWAVVIESGYTAAEILMLIAAATQGDATGLENGSPVFKGMDGATDRITATYVDGTRVVTDRDVS